MYDRCWLNNACSAAIGFLCLFGATEVFAQSEEEVDRFERHVKMGTTLVEEGDYARAIEELEAALVIFDHPRIVFSIAEAYDKWGRCAQARRGYSEITARRGVEERLVTAARGRLDEFDQCIEMTTLIVECAPGTASIVLDGEINQCPLKVDRAVGEVEMRVEAPGYEPQIRRLSLQRDQILREQIVLVPAAAPPVSNVHWMTYAGWGAIGVGSGLLVWGGISDYSAVGRADDIEAARRTGDGARVQSLLDEADSNRTKTALLYTGGVALIGTGIALYWLAPGDDEPSVSDKRAGSGIRVQTRGTTVEFLYRW